MFIDPRAVTVDRAPAERNLSVSPIFPINIALLWSAIRQSSSSYKHSAPPELGVALATPVLFQFYSRKDSDDTRFRSSSRA
jgi:hypothetical protein